MLDAIAQTLPEPPKFLPPIETDYLVWGNLRVHPFKKHFEMQRFNLSRKLIAPFAARGPALDSIQ